jgi:predicted nucleotide-binding protein
LELPTKDANNSTLEAAENQKEKNGTEQPISFIDSHQNCGIDSDSSSAIISRCNSDRISESAIAIKGTSLKDDQNSIQVSEITETSTRRGSKNEHDLEDIFLHLEKLSNVKLEQQRASQPTTNHQKKIRDDLQPIYDSISLLDQSKFDPETIVALLKALGSLQQQANDRISLHSGRTSINSRNSTTIAIDLQNTHVNDIVEKDETTLKKTLFRKFSMANLKKSVSFYKK